MTQCLPTSVESPNTTKQKVMKYNEILISIYSHNLRTWCETCLVEHNADVLAGIEEIHTRKSSFRNPRLMTPSWLFENSWIKHFFFFKLCGSKYYFCSHWSTGLCMLCSQHGVSNTRAAVIMRRPSLPNPGFPPGPGGRNISAPLWYAFLKWLVSPCLRERVRKWVFPPSVSGRPVSKKVLIDFEEVAVGNAPHQ